MGATGNVGGAVVRTLLENNEPVRAIVRPSSNVKQLVAAGCKIAVADNCDVQALTRAFHQAQGVFVMMPFVFDLAPDFPEARELAASLRIALSSARPSRVVLLSTLGADKGRCDVSTQLRILEHELGGLGIPIAFLRAPWFMDNFAADLASARTGSIASFLPPHARLPMAATEDLGSKAAQLMRENWQGIRVVEVEAPYRVSVADAAAAFGASLDTPVTIEPIARKEWESIFSGHGMRYPELRTRFIEDYASGEIGPASVAERHTGKVGIEEFIRNLVASAEAM